MQRSKNMKIAIMCSYIAIFLAFVGYYSSNALVTTAAILVGLVAFGIYFWLALLAISSKFKDKK